MIYSYSSDSSGGNENLISYLFNYYIHNYIYSVPERIKNIFIIDNFYFFSQPLGGLFALIISTVILLPFIRKYKLIKEFFKSFIKKKLSGESGNEINYIIIFFLLSILCYLFLPDIIPGQNIIYERFSVFIYLFIIIICSILYKKAEFRIAYFFPFLCLTVFYFIIISLYFSDFNNETKSFSQFILPDTSENKILSGIIIDNEFRGRPLYIHFPMYNTVWRNGITTGLVDYRFLFIKRKADKIKLPEYKEFLDKDYSYHGEYDRCDYILLRNKEEIEINGFKVTKKNGEWILYSKK